MIRSEYPASESLAREWVECWNLRDIDRLISLYHPDIVSSNPKTLMLQFSLEYLIYKKLQPSEKHEYRNLRRRVWQISLWCQPAK
jgi:hypothetical protein